MITGPRIETQVGRSCTRFTGASQPGSLTTQRLSLNGAIVSDLDFTGVHLDKTAAVRSLVSTSTCRCRGSDAVELINLFSTPLSAGSYLLTVNCHVDPASAINGASYGGTLNLAAARSAAPEPASWAMMVGGFGLLGAAFAASAPATFPRRAASSKAERCPF